uniref:Uncharacterized protein n=1 Tax=Eutreptiella gymnastica TaxID=73025 RepID=A0A7S1NLE4_9EUGL|mmetsp:Transcript_48058/g.85799  ORF Transcript_48058/g.85799 Transcript_48058/m.85799 type:complete len:240 (+) Transcript_48058:37-756(+)
MWNWFLDLIGCRCWTVDPPSMALLTEMAGCLGICCVLNLLLAVLARSGVGAAAQLPIWLGYLALPPYVATTSLPITGAALVLWIGVWKAVDIQMGTAETFNTLPSLALHFMSPVEHRLDAKGNAETAAPFEWARHLRSLLLKYSGLAVLCSLRRSHEYWLRYTGGEVQLGPITARLDLYLYLHVWLVYCFLSLVCDGFSLALSLLGLRPKTMFRSPLIASYSPRDFWSRRWLNAPPNLS